MPHFFFKLIPPRPTFGVDMTPAEGVLMQQHAAYLAAQQPSGNIVLVGPVLNPHDTFGLAILEMDNLAQARDFGENDPSVKAGLNTFEVHPFYLSYLRR